MKIKILKVYEKNNVLRVETECAYGLDNLGLGLQTKYLDPVSGKPKYLGEVKKLLLQKYSKNLAVETPVDEKSWGKEVDLDKV